MKQPEHIQVGMETLFWTSDSGIGGIERYAERLARGLVRNDVGLTVFTGNNALDLQTQRKVVHHTENQPFDVIYHANVDALLSNLEETVQRGGVNVVQIEDVWGLKDKISYLERVLSLRVPIIWETHNQKYLSEKFPYRSTAPELFDRFARRVDMFVCKSESITREARENGIETSKIRTIYNPVDESIFHPVSDEKKQDIRTVLGIPPDKRVILYVGRIAPGKGSDFLMSGWDSIRRIHPEYHLVMVGGLQSGDVLEAQYKEFQTIHTANHSASFSAGFVKDEQVLSGYFQVCDMFLLPSPLEGLGNVLIEAMACGKPCIVSRNAQEHSGAGDLIIPGNNGVVFEEYTAESLMHSLERVTDDMGEKGYDFFRSVGFGIDTIAQQYRTLYRNLVYGTPFSVAMVT